MMLAKRLQEMREKRGLIQDVVAKAIGVSRSTYALYEAGAREPNLATLNRIADYFTVTTDYLLGRTAFKQAFEDGLTGEDRGRIEMVTKGLMEYCRDYSDLKKHNAYFKCLTNYLSELTDRYAVMMKEFCQGNPIWIASEELVAWDGTLFHYFLGSAEPSFFEGGWIDGTEE